MNNSIITIRDSMIARDNIVLIEPFDPAKGSGISNPERFAGRLLFRDGNSMLTEQTPAAFAAEHGFRFLGKPDHIATNPDITFKVQKFDLVQAQSKNPEFQPERSFATRLSWGKGGPGESRLLQNDPPTVAAVVLLGQQDRNDPAPIGAAKPAARPK
jgi:hypothetical protein